MTYAEFYQYGLVHPQMSDTPTSFIILAVACAIIGYLIGSLNFGVMISLHYGKDVRDTGSGNAGATNMTRLYGKKVGIMTFIGDFLKMVVCAYAGMAFIGCPGAYIAGIFCILGHAYPIYFKFKGGKGVACVAALGLITTWDVFLVLLVIFIILLFGFKMVSFASVMTMVIYPFVLSQMRPIEFVAYGFFAALLVVFLHRKNIARIFNHTEPKISFGKNKRNKDEEK